VKWNNFPAVDSFATEEKWDTADLIRRLCRVLGISRQTVALLAAEGFKNPDNPTTNIPSDKIIGETAFLLFAASIINTYKEVRERIEDLAALLIPYARNKNILLKICLQPALALDYAQAHICLTKMGYPDLKFDRLLEKAISAHSFHGKEHPPNRVLEQAWIKKNWSYHSRNEDEDLIIQAIAQSALNKPLDVLLYTCSNVCFKL
jgi:hypothetical protein